MRMEKSIPLQVIMSLQVVMIICPLLVINAEAHLALTTVRPRSPFSNITILDSAVFKGAVCLDGSPPAYYYAAGEDCGAKNWLIYLQGGGWCKTDGTCISRAKSLGVGSSYKMNNRTYFGGLLSGKPTVNPDFYNWNRVFVAYCDGSSFLSDVEAVDPKTNLTFRGNRIFEAVMEELLNKGMKDAQNVLLSGGSAGGLATILHCDRMRALVPQAQRVKCLSDSGFFISAKFLTGASDRVKDFEDVVQYHKISKSLPEWCTSKLNPKWCIFPENIIDGIQTPIFALESAFDSWKMKMDVAPSYHNGTTIPSWEKCISNTTFCTIPQLLAMRHYGATFVHTLQEKFGNSPNRGLFVHSCYIHAAMHLDHTWSKEPVVNGKTIGQAFGDWYMDRSTVMEIDTKNTIPVSYCGVPIFI